MNLSIEHNLDGLLSKLQGAKPRVLKFVAQVYFKRLSQGVAHAKTQYLVGGTTSTRLRSRSGHLRSAFGMQVKATGDDVMGRIGYIIAQPVGPDGANALVYARVHEGWPDRRRSTTIRAKGGGYLPVPLPAAMTPAGVMRGRPRDFPDTFVRRSAAGNLIIFQEIGNGEIEPLFVLKSEVTIPARPALVPTVDKFIPLILDDLRQGVPDVILGSSTR